MKTWPSLLWFVTIATFGLFYSWTWMARENDVRDESFRRECLKSGRSSFAEYNGVTCKAVSK